MKSLLNNLYSFYKLCSVCEGYNTKIDEEGFSYIKTDDFNWPNYTFNTNYNLHRLTSLDVEKINLDIEEKKLPPFVLLLDEILSDEVEEYFYTFNIRKIDLWPVMYKKTSSIQHVQPEQNALKIKTVTSGLDFENWYGIVKNVLYPKKNIDINLFMFLWKSKNVDLLIGSYNGIPVATSMVYYDNEYAGLYQVATINEYRKRGFGEQITNESILTANKKGYKYITLQASRMAYNLYKRIGFKNACDVFVFWKLGFN